MTVIVITLGIPHEVGILVMVADGWWLQWVTHLQQRPAEWVLQTTAGLTLILTQSGPRALTINTLRGLVWQNKYTRVSFFREDSR